MRVGFYIRRLQPTDKMSCDFFLLRWLSSELSEGGVSAYIVIAPVMNTVHINNLDHPNCAKLFVRDIIDSYHSAEDAGWTLSCRWVPPHSGLATNTSKHRLRSADPSVFINRLVEARRIIRRLPAVGSQQRTTSLVLCFVVCWTLPRGRFRRRVRCYLTRNSFEQLQRRGELECSELTIVQGTMLEHLPFGFMCSFYCH